MGLTKTTAPSTEPLTTAEAKTHLRIDTGDEDALIDTLIMTARRMSESYTSRQLLTATYELKCNDFPGGYGVIRLPRTPLGSVTSITYVDTSGASQTLSTDVYEVLSDDVSATVVLKPGQTWPSVQSEKYEAVTVTFTAGYGAASDVPASVKNAMKLLIGHLFENREAVNVGNIVTEMPLAVSSLLDTVAVPKVV